MKLWNKKVMNTSCLNSYIHTATYSYSIQRYYIIQDRHTLLLQHLESYKVEIEIASAVQPFT